MPKKKQNEDEARAGVKSGPPTALPRSLPAMFTWEREIDRLFDEFRRFALPGIWGPERQAHGGLRAQAPAVDLYDLEDEVVVRVELPGMTKEDIEIHIADSTLTLKGEKRSHQKIEEHHYYRRECQYGSFLRSIELPSEARTEAVRANLQNGVLEIRLPKSDTTRRKAIKVEVQ